MRCMTLILGLSLVACQSLPDDGKDVVTVEANDLNITQLEIGHSVVDGDKLLTLRGLDDAGEPIATATLRTGMVLYDGGTEPTAGTELIISVGTASSSYVSPDRKAHDVPEPTPGASFVHLHAVAAAIEAEAGIGFVASPFSPRSGAEIELAAGGTSCTGSRFPTTKGNSTNCCQYPAYTGHRSSAGALVIRTTFDTNLTACLDSSGFDCFGEETACYYGPCGFAITHTSGNDAKLFQPPSDRTYCGYDDNGTAAGGYYAPELYTGVNQPLWPGMTAQCPYTGCAYGGTPQVAHAVAGFMLTMTTIARPTNGYLRARDVAHMPPDTYWDSRYTPKAPLKGGATVNMTAYDPNNHLITISGACSASGTGSAACSFTMPSADTSVTATFH